MWIKIQGIDGAIDTVRSLSIVSCPASASVGLVKPFRSPFPGELLESGQSTVHSPSVIEGREDQ